MESRTRAQAETTEKILALGGLKPGTARTAGQRLTHLATCNGARLREAIKKRTKARGVPFYRYASTYVYIHTYKIAKSLCLEKDRLRCQVCATADPVP